jgi:trafficking kinesin-binding protein 1
LENEELVLQLRVVRDCQNELAAELSDYKDKYAECLAMMRETQEQLKQQNKRNMPTASNMPNVSGLSRGPSTSYHPDSLASELELSSLGSDGWPSDFSLPPPTNNTANHTR